MARLCLPTFDLCEAPPAFAMDGATRTRFILSRRELSPAERRSRRVTHRDPKEGSKERSSRTALYRLDRLASFGMLRWGMLPRDPTTPLVVVPAPYWP